jgi:hypothetical protein
MVIYHKVIQLINLVNTPIDILKNSQTSIWSVCRSEWQDKGNDQCDSVIVKFISFRHRLTIYCSSINLNFNKLLIHNIVFEGIYWASLLRDLATAVYIYFSVAIGSGKDS